MEMESVARRDVNAVPETAGVLDIGGKTAALYHAEDHPRGKDRVCQRPDGRV